MIESILHKLNIENDVVKLPNIQLDRKTYIELKNRLEKLGGKWNRKAQGFVFKAGIPLDEFNKVKSGEKVNLKKDLQFFETPEILAKKLVKLADIHSGDHVLEPSAGHGAIISEILKTGKIKYVYAYELHPINQSFILKRFGDEKVNFLGKDFLKHSPDIKKFDKIIANPPYSKNQDIAHVLLMYNSLRAGGKMVVLTSKHWKISKNKKETEFREFLNKVNAKIEIIPEKTFKKSGTNIETVLIIIDKKNNDKDVRNKAFALLQTINKSEQNVNVQSEYRFTDNDFQSLTKKHFYYTFEGSYLGINSNSDADADADYIAEYDAIKERLTVLDMSKHSEILKWLADNSFMSVDDAINFQEAYTEKFETGGEIDEKVEKYLSEKQKNKQLKDTSVVKYTRKYKRALSKISVSDLDELEKDKINAHRLITKKNLWDEFDIEKLKKDGNSSGVAYLKVQLRKALSSKPKDSVSYRKKYVEIINKLEEELPKYKTDISELRLKLLYNIIDNGISEFGFNGFKNIVSARFIYLCKYSGDSKSAREIIREANKINYSRKDLLKQKELYLEALKKRVIESEKWCDEMLGKATEIRYNIELNKIKKYKECITKIEQGEYDCARKISILFNTFAFVNINNYTDTGDWSWAEVEIPTKTKKQKTKPEISTIYDKEGFDIEDVKYRKPLGLLQRTKGLEIPEITTESIQMKFGYKDVVFGNYLSSKEGREHARHFLASMLDLADILNIDIKEINQLGGLSIAFGAMGCGGKGVACYYPNRKVINVTKRRGDGSIAHEWGHYLDNILMDKDIYTNNPEFATDTSEWTNSLPVNVKDAILDIVEYMENGDSGDNKEKQIEVIFYPFSEDEKKYNYSHIIGKEIDNTKEAVETVFRKYSYLKRYDTLFGNEKRTRKTHEKNIFRYIATRFNKEYIKVKFNVDKSNYYTASLQYETDPKKKYWTSRKELFARAFEKFVETKLSEKGRVSDYLVKIDLDFIPVEKRPYPYGHELKELNKRFNTLLRAIKTDFNIKKFSWYTDKRTDFFEEKEKTMSQKITALLNIIKKRIKTLDK